MFSGSSGGTSGGRPIASDAAKLDMSEGEGAIGVCVCIVEDCLRAEAGVNVVNVFGWRVPC